MVTRNDMCKCGHPRSVHNNRIKGIYYSELKYNSCLGFDGTKHPTVVCKCIKFRNNKLSN